MSKKLFVRKKHLNLNAKFFLIKFITNIYRNFVYETKTYKILRVTMTVKHIKKPEIKFVAPELISTKYPLLLGSP